MQPQTPAKQATPSRAQVHLALAFVAVLFSLNYILGKIALRDLRPLALTWLRVAGSALLLVSMQWRDRARAPLALVPERQSIFVFALLGVVVNQVFFLTGLSLTTAHEAAILITTIPVFTLAGAIMLGRERGSATRIGGIVIAAIGALMIIGFEGIQGSAASFAGDTLVTINCLSYGTYLVVSKPMMRKYPATRVVSNMFLLATGMLVPVCAYALWTQNWGAVRIGSWGALAGIIIGPTVLAYVVNAWALGHADSSTVAAYTYLQPFIASILATLLLGEVIPPSDIIAGVVICVGVWLSSRGATSPASDP